MTVFTADRGYDDPSQRYRRFERQGNVEVVRLPFCSFGKGSIAQRLLGGVSLVVQASVLTTLDLRLTDLLISTIPHMAGAVGLTANKLRQIPFHYWLMDLNPDQIVALGKIRPDSLAVKAFELLNRGLLRHATTITVLDDAMAQRFSRKSEFQRNIDVQPPWPFQDQTDPIDHSKNSFRLQFGLNLERVVMHAGNHSAVHPLDTLMQAIQSRPTTRLKYFFVGGGVGKANLERWLNDQHPADVTLLPYQPREQVPATLCAADIHVVSVGTNTVGIVHPSKIYGALAAGRPVLVLGPRESPAARLVRDNDVGWHVEHGDVEGMCTVLRTIGELSDHGLDGNKVARVAIRTRPLQQRVGCP